LFPESPRFLHRAEKGLAEKVLGQGRVMGQGGKVAVDVAPVAAVQFLDSQHGVSLLSVSAAPRAFPGVRGGAFRSICPVRRQSVTKFRKKIAPRPGASGT